MIIPAPRRIKARLSATVTALDPRERRRRRRILHHRARRPPRSVLVPDIAPGEQDIAIARRLLAAHRATMRTVPSAPSGPDVWSLIADAQRDFATLLQSGDPEPLAAYLCNVSRHSASDGIV